MEWINLHIPTLLRSPEFIGAEPVDRSTFIMLLAFCASLENGGVIRDCAEWKDRKWQQIAAVTLAEVRRKSELWTWHGNDLHVSFYPVEKEAEVKHLRGIGSLSTPAKAAAAKANGKRGGRPNKNPPQNPTENPTPWVSGTEQETEQETHEKPIERKGREGKGKEGKGSERADARRRAEALVSACPFPDLTTTALEAAAACLGRHPDIPFEDILAACQRITALYREWPENERIAFRSTAERFFREDHWRKSEDAWRSRRAARLSSNGAFPPLDLGRSAPESGDLIFPSPTRTTAAK